MAYKRDLSKPLAPTYGEDKKRKVEMSLRLLEKIQSVMQGWLTVPSNKLLEIEKEQSVKRIDKVIDLLESTIGRWLLENLKAR